MEITPDKRVSEILREYPELTDFMMDIGLCGCGLDSNLNWSLARVAREKGLNLSELIDEIKSRVNG
ncbi:MAG: DUF1858 domain-containing protein [Nitrospirae bacterium]|nr:MAG: DUF1858 domain-containing protein [Nitrospirota bacterium]